MNKGTVALLAFAAGAAGGYFTAKKVLEEKYAQLAQEEIDSVKERFRLENKPEEEKKSEPAGKATKEERKEYVHYAHSLGYTQEEGPAAGEEPRVISPDEFGELAPEYDTVSLTYYADHVLTGEDGKPMDEYGIESQVGKESLNHFGEYEEDSVFVRNDRLKVDYEILLEERKYSDTLPKAR